MWLDLFAGYTTLMNNWMLTLHALFAEPILGQRLRSRRPEAQNESLTVLQLVTSLGSWKPGVCPDTKDHSLPLRKDAIQKHWCF
ncbi:hypothetical protein DFP72DRAFT_316269 [Ephemerocybe angulata]|uniref:Uncharacterized protein n=1 Tax=Ephemerocybe angulata TaxID=980116 RepID=A0A8H6H628_9AGAR|nr:hypothetical protein DFP72DRAFT_316269 [Tulosesus angulatus]